MSTPITGEAITKALELIEKLIELIGKKKKSEERQKAKDGIAKGFLALAEILIDISLWNSQLNKDPEEQKKLERAKKKFEEVKQDYEKALEADKEDEDDVAKEWLTRTRDDLEELQEILQEIAQQKQEKLSGTNSVRKSKK